VSDETLNEGEQTTEGGDQPDLAAELEQAKAALAEKDAAIAEAKRRAEEAQKELVSDEFLDYLESRQKGTKAPAQAEPEGDSDPFSGLDFSMASQEEVARAVLKATTSQVSKLAKEMADGKQEIAQALGTIMAQANLKAAEAKYPELSKALNDTKDGPKLRKISEENPTWDIERVWKQFRIERLAESKEAEDAAATKREAERLARTERPGTPISTVADRVMTKEEALEKALVDSGFRDG
jgi:hypothetical protein